MLQKGTKVTFTTPATKVGTVIDHIPAYENRNKYIVSFLYGNSDDIELRLGASPIMEEDSYLIITNGSCAKCRKRLYHIPASYVHAHDV